MEELSLAGSSDSWQVITEGNEEMATGCGSVQVVPELGSVLPSALKWGKELVEKRPDLDKYWIKNIPGLETIIFPFRIHSQVRNMPPEEMVHFIRMVKTVAVKLGGSFGRIFPMVLASYIQQKQIARTRLQHIQNGAKSIGTLEERVAKSDEPESWMCSGCGETMLAPSGVLRAGLGSVLGGKCINCGYMTEPVPWAPPCLHFRTEQGVFQLSMERGGWSLLDPLTSTSVSVSSKELEQFAMDTSTLASKPYTGKEVKYHCLKGELGEGSQATVSVAEIMGRVDRHELERAMPGSMVPGLGEVFRTDF